MKNAKIKFALAGINFCLTDVRDGLGPFLVMYLMTINQLSISDIGLMITVAGVTKLLFRIPAGAFIDWCRYKRFILSLASGLITISMLVIQLSHQLLLLLCATFFIGMASAFMLPAISAITLGTVGSSCYAKQVGTNQSFNHSGNIFSCLMAVIFASTIGLSALSTFTAVMAFLVIVSTVMIKQNDINHSIARGLTAQDDETKPSSFKVLLENKALFMFGLSILLFHLANASMLLLLGHEVATINSSETSIRFIAGSIIITQAVMVLMALLVKFKVDLWGRKPLFLIAFLALPVRGLLFLYSANPYYLLAVQLLDGIGIGLYSALLPIVAADFTRGTGRYNITLGALSAMHGMGTAVSKLISGYIAVAFGFKVTFVVLTCFALMAMLIFASLVPESQNYNGE